MSTLVCLLVIAPVVGCHLFRVFARAPLHLLAAEQRAYRNVSVLSIGLILLGAPIARVSPFLWLAWALLVGSAGSRIGTRLHLANPLAARIACVPAPDGLHRDATTVACVSGGVHDLPAPVVGLLAPRTISRTDLRDLPNTFIGGSDEHLITATRQFLRTAQDCGCVALVPETSTNSNLTSEDAA